MGSIDLEEQCFEFEDTSSTHETRTGRSVAVGFFGDKSNLSRMRSLLLIGLVGASARPSDEPRLTQTSRPPIFRQVSFPPFSAITLGEPLPERAPPTVLIGLRRAAFAHPLGDADSIFVEWDTGKRVRVVEFLYPSTKSVSKAVADYEALLGVDRQHVVTDSAGQRLERWLWRDQATMFELSSLTVGEKPTRVWSILRDRIGLP